MNLEKTINLLLLCASSDEADSYLDLFRNTGQAARIRRIHSLPSLDEELASQSWDLLILTEHNPEITPEQILEKLANNKADTPAICVLRKPTHEQILKLQHAGAQDVVGIHEMERLLIIARREITRINEHRELILLKTRLEETQNRCELLLDSSNEAITYITDGMHINVNAEYASLLGYSNPDDLLCLPVVDLIAETDQAAFKNFIKARHEGSADNNDLCVTVRHADGSTFTTRIFASNSSFDGETCTQLILRQPATPSQPETNHLQDLHKKTQLITLLEERINGAHRGKSAGQIMLIGFDDLARIRAHNGFTNTELAINELIELLTVRLESQESIVRFANDSLLLSTYCEDTDRSMLRAKELCSLLNNHICEIDQRTIRCNCRLVVYPLGEQTPTAQQVLDACFTALFGIQQTSTDFLRLVTEKPATPAGPELLSNLQSAIDQEQLLLQFQPVVSLHGDSQGHYEVFTVMKTEDATHTSLSEKEESLSNEMHLSLDRWRVENALAKLAGHTRADSAPRLIINLSQATVLDEGFSSWINLAISQSAMPAESLIFQIRLHDAGSYLNITERLTSALKKIGCRISISEVSGDSHALATLRHLPVDYAKLHNEFITELHNTSNQAEALSVLKELRNIGIKTIIPRVESASILPVIWQCGADFIQGNYLQAPSDNMNYDFNDVA